MHNTFFFLQNKYVVHWIGWLGCNLEGILVIVLYFLINLNSFIFCKFSVVVILSRFLRPRLLSILLVQICVKPWNIIDLKNRGNLNFSSTPRTKERAFSDWQFIFFVEWVRISLRFHWEFREISEEIILWEINRRWKNNNTRRREITRRGGKSHTPSYISIWFLLYSLLWIPTTPTFDCVYQVWYSFVAFSIIRRGADGIWWWWISQSSWDFARE